MPRSDGCESIRLPADLDAALQKTELTLDELGALVKRELQVENYIQERFAPMIVVTSDEIETYYKGPLHNSGGSADCGAAARLRAGRDPHDVESVTVAAGSREMDAELRSRADVDGYTWR